MTVPSPQPEPGQNKPIPAWVADKYNLWNSGLEIDFLDTQPPRQSAEHDPYVAFADDLKAQLDGTNPNLTWFERMLFRLGI